jgi:uncharacterized protein YcaQ
MEGRRLKVFQHRMLRKVFGPKRDKVTGEWRRRHKEELYDLYSTEIFWFIRSRRMRWAESMGGEEKHTGIWWGKLRERDNLEDLGR